MLKDVPVTTVLPVDDIRRAKKFYSERLGLKTPDIPTPEDGAAFESGDGTMIYLYKYEGGGTKTGHTVATWMVKDVEKTVDDLRARGVTFESYDMPGLKTDKRGIAEAEGTRGAWFKDTEGNILSIAQMPS